jgi:hypothetical protein
MLFVILVRIDVSLRVHLVSFMTLKNLRIASARPLDSETEPPSVSAEVLDEYYFLRDIVA